MNFRTTKELGALVRARRNELGYTQAQLAESAGVKRLWVIQFEAGKPTVEMALVLRTLKALDMVLDLQNAEDLTTPEINLDTLIDGQD